MRCGEMGIVRRSCRGSDPGVRDRLAADRLRANQQPAAGDHVGFDRDGDFVGLRFCVGDYVDRAADDRARERLAAAFADGLAVFDTAAPSPDCGPDRREPVLGAGSGARRARVRRPGALGCLVSAWSGLRVL